MANLYLLREDQIGFEQASGDDDNWLRVDRDEEGIFFDRSGLCKLERVELGQLVEWLVEAAQHLPVQDPQPEIRRRRKRSERIEGVGIETGESHSIGET